MSHEPVIQWKPLGELLVNRGLLSADELETALAEQVQTGELLGAILVRRKAITSVALTTILAEQAGVELETQGGFGSGLFSKIAERHCPDDEPAQQQVVQPARGPSVAEEDRPLSEAAAELNDPAYELSALRVEVEMLRGRNAELEAEISAKAARRRPSKSAA
jgi:hypothetical protein